MLAKLLIHRNSIRYLKASSTNKYVRSLIYFQNFEIKTASKAIPTKSSDNQEDFNNLLLQLKSK